MAEQANLVLLGCRAEDLSTMLKTVQPGQSFADKTVVSLMAGLSFQGLRQQLVDSGAPDSTPLVRVIPTFGARAANSASLMAVGPSASDKDVEVAEKFFKPLGTLLRVDESMLNKGVAVGAACHALAVTAIDTITDAGVAEGIPRSTAFALVAQNLASASKLMADGMSAEELKAALSTPSGITLNSVMQLERGGARVGVADAARAAIKYAESM